jgi:polyisoprenoid-binding protein YceI
MRHIWIALAYWIVSTTGATADVFTLDRQHTEVRFSWDHLGLSRQSGRFTDVTGTVQFDAEKPETSTVNVSIALASLMTGVPALDSHLLKTREYFDVAANPAILFKSSGVRQTGDKTAELIGDLTINGITKPVTMAVVWNYLGDHPLAVVNPTYAGKTVAGFSARTHILRSDWGLTRTIPLVSDEIRISIEAEMSKTQ